MNLEPSNEVHYQAADQTFVVHVLYCPMVRIN